MESNEIFEKSLITLNSVQKTVMTNRCVIDFDSLDTVTAGALKDAIAEVTLRRTAEIKKVILNNVN